MKQEIVIEKIRYENVLPDEKSSFSVINYLLYVMHHTVYILIKNSIHEN